MKAHKAIASPPVLIKLTDGNIEKIVDYTWSDGAGCPTCGYDKGNVVELDIYSTRGRFRFASNKDKLSQSSCLNAILPHLGDIQQMTISDFISHLEKHFKIKAKTI